MTVSSTNNRNNYTGNDTTAIYNYTFKVFLASELKVFVKETATDIETELAITTDYTVQDAGESAGGTITLVDAGQDWISGTSNLDTGYTMTIRRVVALTQETDIRNQGDFFPETHEDVFDKLTMADQQQQDDLDRSVTLPDTTAIADFDPELPTDLEGTSDVALVTNATGDGWAVGPSTTDISSAAANASAAAASAAAALVSEGNASTSETNAATSESNAATSESNAATSESNAATSESNAATSESNAATSESNAATSETNAGVSETNAGTSESNAATSESNAATSESNAATSETNAGISETNAGISETNAGVSETNAAASAAAAATSAAASLWNDVSYKTFADTPISIVDGDTGTLFAVDCSGGNVVINLPSIAALTLSAPWSVGIKKTDSSSNTITINRDGTDTIDGATSKVITRQDSGTNLIPDVDGSPDDWTSLTYGEVPISGAIVGDTDTQTLTNKTLTSPVIDTGVSGTAILDEDNMSSDSATQLATQQSIKAYADTKLPEPAGNGIAVRTAADTSVNRTLTGTTDEIDVSNGDGVSGNPTVGIADDPILPGTGAVTVPTGTTAQQPTPVNGMARYNSTDSKFEFREGGAWVNYSSGSGGTTVETAYIKYVVSSGSLEGGSSTSYSQRLLNTLSDPDGIVTSLVSSQFTLPAGEYDFWAECPTYDGNSAKSKLRNVTDSTDEIIGAFQRVANGTNDTIRSVIMGRISIAGSKTFELQTRVGNAVAVNGLGSPAGFGDDEVYSQCRIVKLS